MLRKQLYVVFTKPVKGMEPVMAVLEEHLAFQIDLEQRGIMFGAGPFWNDAEDAWEGEGMVILRAGSLAEAKAWPPPTRCTSPARAATRCGRGCSTKAR